MATNYTERKWEAQLEWSQVYRQEPRRLEKICRQPMFLMEISTLLLLLLLLLLLSSSSFLVTGFLSSMVLLLLSQWWTPPLRLQVSACSTFLMMCDVPSMAVFCKESIECYPGIVSTYFCKLLLTIPVARMITGMTKHFMLYILWISILRFLYFTYYHYYYYYYVRWCLCGAAAANGPFVHPPD
jgi:hypothetical protein